ncbi:MAG: FAD-binding oxidoreductase [Gammaproteobacteria bacterium]|nr:FAD-binding oxidoreductase [Gammaproteobacteria bacterium]MDH3468241.1 FAD-binding oxidoreductase [Gammaproteobacteria bacterium]
MINRYRQLTFWHDSLPGELQPRPVLDRDIEADIAIVGAGYAGLWTAYYLKQIDPSLDIVVLEAEIAGYGASGRNGGWCSSHVTGIEKWFEDPQHKAAALHLQRLMFKTVEEIGWVTEKESIDCHFDQSGALEIAVQAGQLNRLKQELAHLRELGFGEEDYQWLDAGEMKALLDVDGGLGGFRLSHCAAVHPARLARGLADCVERMGVKIYEQSPVLNIEQKVLTLPAARVRAEINLITTEGYTANLAKHRKRLTPIHSMMVATEPLNQEQLAETGFKQRYTFGNFDRATTYGQLTADKRIAFGCRGTYLFGSGIRTSFDPAEPVFDIVRNTLLQFFPGLRGVGFTHAWGGAMGVARSMQPSVHFNPSTGQGWAGGFFGSGVAATHLAAQTLADLVTGQDTERLQTPWVNSPDAHKIWEPEPFRWVGIRYTRAMMQVIDRIEYRSGRFSPAVCRVLDRLLP